MRIPNSKSSSLFQSQNLTSLDDGISETQTVISIDVGSIKPLPNSPWHSFSKYADDAAHVKAASQPRIISASITQEHGDGAGPHRAWTQESAFVPRVLTVSTSGSLAAAYSCV
ncbi:hypothetical protein EYC80_001139 [Monilinia laxa]|uniref:Uncharacterized protein n=1 Tax=Monilinia laxa TaxID=61186 RepID=A0A5N6K8B1_MONLA|nr:hypothetical protein EYC80_001139 [Monilinia laxa]